MPVLNAADGKVCLQFQKELIYHLPDVVSLSLHFTQLAWTAWVHFLLKVGEATKKRGLLFKCLTIRSVRLEVLASIDVNLLLMALRQFIVCQGTSAELYTD